MTTVRMISKYPGYVITPDGRVQGPGRRGTPRWLKQTIMSRTERRAGYLYVNIRSNSGVKRPVAVHTLVSLAYHGDPEPGQEVRHLNGDPFDNRAKNLAWGTRAENVADAVKHGTWVQRPPLRHK